MNATVLKFRGKRMTKREAAQARAAAVEARAAKAASAASKAAEDERLGHGVPSGSEGPSAAFPEPGDAVQTEAVGAAGGEDAPNHAATDPQSPFTRATWGLGFGLGHKDEGVGPGHKDNGTGDDEPAAAATAGGGGESNEPDDADGEDPNAGEKPDDGAGDGESDAEAARRAAAEEELERLRAKHDEQHQQNTGREPPKNDEATFADILAKAKHLAKVAKGALDATEAKRLIRAAAWFIPVEDPDRSEFLSAIKSAGGAWAHIPELKAIWDDEAAKARLARAPSPEKAAELAAEAARLKEEAKRAESDRLEPIAAPIAKDPKLLDRMLATVAALGVVREESAVLAVFLTATSRLLRRRCLSLLRKGAPASGKNFLFEQVFKLLPPESVVIFNSASAQALIYHGAGDENSLKHMLVYLPEASSTLAVKGGVESDFTAALRQLISDNRINRQVSLAQRDGPPITMEVVKNGPIAVCVSTARNDVEEELDTRLLRGDSDESQHQTGLVVTAIMEDAAGTPLIAPPSDAEIEEWQEYQRWLEAGGPYDVVIPFTPAIRAAFALPSAVRVRRDISGLLAAVSASAVIHKGQRQVDAKGRLVATIDDYRHAFDAFALGMAALYRPQLSAAVIALVKAIETMIKAERARIEDEKAAFRAKVKDPNAALPPELHFDETVRATHKQLKGALGIASDDAVTSRIGEALTAGAIERVNPEAARSFGARYRVKVGSADLKASAGVPIFPLSVSVEKLMNNPAKLAEALAALAPKGADEDTGEDTDDEEEKDPYPF